MRREELIRKNRESFSNLRKWSMQRGYYPSEQLETNMKGIMFAGLIGTGVIASAATSGAIPTHALLGLSAATVIAAKSARVGTFVAIIAHKTSLHKLVVQATFRMGDRARAIFQRTMDGIFKVHPDITRTRELADSLAKIKFHADGMIGVAIDKNTEFNPKTNIFLPVSKLDSNSPLFAKNKQIYSEIVEMIDNGRLTKQEIQELNAFTKGTTAFSLDKSCHYDKNVNYAVLVGKLEGIMEKVCSIQDNRESLKIDGADVIEKFERREDRKRVVKPAPIANEIQVLEGMVEKLGVSIVEPTKEPETAIKVVYDEIDFQVLKERAQEFAMGRNQAENVGDKKLHAEFSRKFIDTQAVLNNGVDKSAIEAAMQKRNVPEERKIAYVEACMANAAQLKKVGLLQQTGESSYSFVSPSDRCILNASIGEPYKTIKTKVTEHRMSAIKDIAASAPEGVSVTTAIENLQKSDKTPDQTIK